MTNTSYWYETMGRRLSRRRTLALGAGAATGAALLAACGGSDGDGDKGSDKASLVAKPEDTSKQAKRGGAFQWVTATESPSFDLSTANLANNDKVIFAYNTLLQVKPGHMQIGDRDIAGDLAESWEFSPDKLTLTMKLRPGVKWHNKAPVNGRAFDMEDVLFSWDRVARIAADRGQIANSANPDAPILSMTAADSRTLVIKLKYPLSYILGILARNFGAKVNMVPKETDTTFDSRRDMIGTGAYMLSNYTPSGSYTFKLNPEYYEPDHHYVDQINMPIISEPATALAQFKAGHIYHWPNLQGENVPVLMREAPEILVYQNDFTGGGVAGINTAFGYLPGSPFNDERVRQAYSMSTDRDLWIDVAYNVGEFESQGLPVDKRWNTSLTVDFEGWWVDPKGKEMGDAARYFEHNVAEAKKLLSAAGFPSGLEVNFTHPALAGSGYPPQYPRYVAVLIGMAQEAGFRAKEKEVPYQSDFVPNYRDASGKFDGIASKTGTTIADDAVASLASRFDSTAGAQFYGFDAGGKGNQSGDPQVDSMIVKAKAEIDTEKRKEIVRDLQRYLGKKQYIIRWPGSATGFDMAWPVVKNFRVFRPPWSRLAPHFWWLDETKAPVKKT